MNPVLNRRFTMYRGFTMSRSRQRHRQIVRDLASVIGSCLLTARRLALTLGTRQLAPGNQGLVVSFRHVQADEVLLSLHEKCRPYTGGLGAHGLRGRNAAVTAGFFLTHY